MLTINLDSVQLFAALKRAAMVHWARSTIPILQNVKVETAEDCVSFTVTDLDRELRLDVPAAIHATGSAPIAFLVAFPELFRAAQALKKAGPVALSLVEKADGVFSAELQAADSSRVYSFSALFGCYDVMQESKDAAGSKIMVKTGERARYADEFPLFKCEEVGAEVAGLSAPGDVIASSLALVVGAASTEETRYYLNGVFFYSDANGRGIAATDGHRLNQMDWNGATFEGADRFGFIVPTGAVKVIEALAREAKAVRVSFSEKLAHVAGPDFYLKSKLIDGTFPDFWRVVPQSSKDRIAVEFDAAEVCDFLKTAAQTICEDRDNSVALVVNGSFEAFARRPGAEIRERFAADISKPEKWEADDALKVGVNAKYLGEALSDFRRVKIEILDPAAPIRITSPELAGVRVLMPLRLK